MFFRGLIRDNLATKSISPAFDIENPPVPRIMLAA